MLSHFGRACFREFGYKSTCYARCSHLCEKFGLMKLVDLLWLRNFSHEGITCFAIEYDRNIWKNESQKDCNI